jgi:hypothetical protein
MRILKSVQSKVCVDGSIMKEYLLDEPLSEEFLEFLGRFGTIKYLSHMELPFFTFEKEQFLSVKGFVGDRSVEVRYRKEFFDLVSDYFHLLLFYEGQGKEGVQKLKGIEESIRKKMAVRLAQPEGSSP